ncbi:MAG: hypothetical protein KKG59_04930 [Nanoarchaeota archaeon]|nr:hypothetical protein [Nanoarchaeota archaeon]
MVHYLNDEEIETLRSYVGKDVKVDTACSHQDENGVASNGGTVIEGTLVDILSHEPNRVDYVVLGFEGYNLLTIFNLTDGSHVWNIKKGLYHDREELISVRSDGTEMPKLVGETRTYLEHDYLAQNGLVRLLE